MATRLFRGRREHCGPWLGLAALGFLSFVARSAAADNTPAVFHATFQDRRYSNPLNWSPQVVPNNVGATHYDVVLPQLPPNISEFFFPMMVDTDATISNLFYGGFQVNVVDHNLVVNETFTSGDLIVMANSADASATFGHYASVSAAGVLNAGVDLQAASGKAAVLRFGGANIVSSNWSLSLSGSGARIVDEFGNDGLRNFAANRGAFFLSGGASFTSGGDFYNGGEMTISAEGASADVGCFVTGNLLNFDKSSHVLSGGTFLFTGQGSAAASPASVLRFRDADIVSNAADIEIQSARARIVDQFGNDALRHLAHNAAQGVLTFDHSGDYSTPGDFTNDGQIAMGGGTFTVTAALSNYANHELTGGTYRAFTSQGVPGIIRINDADVISNAATIDLDGPGSGIVDQFGNDALRHLAHISVGGSFSIEGNASRDIPGDFTNDGELRVRAKGPGEACALTIHGNLSNFSGGTLTGGRFILDDTITFGVEPTPSATLTFPGADIRTNSAYLYLGYRARINDENGNDGLRHFATNAASGTLTIGWGASFAVPGPLANAGRLELLYGSLIVPGALLSPGTINMQGGTLTADSITVPLGGTLSNFGTIVGDVDCAGSLVVDDLANGALSIKGRLKLTSSSRTAVSYGTTPGIFLNRAPTAPYITVDGPVTLAGVLDFPTVLLVSGSVAPRPEDEFILIDATSLSGAFNNVANGGRITTDDGLWSFLVEYGTGANANRLVLTDATPVPEPAAAILLAGWYAVAFAGRRNRRRPASPRR